MTTVTPTPRDELRSMRIGVLLSLLAILFGFGFGGAFGAFEDSLKGGLKTDGEAVLATTYGGDTAKLKEVLDKSFTYYKRAHLHGGAMGAAALAVILALAFAGAAPRLLRQLASLALGLAALGYPLFWLLAGRRAPGLGSTGAAKEALEWLAVPSAGLALVGLVLASVCVAWGLFAAPPQAR